MILDRLENWELYFTSPLMGRVRDCLLGLGPDAEPGERLLAGRDARVNVFEAGLRPLESARFEAHRLFVDVQAALLGEEGCAWSPLPGLVPAGDYDADKDVIFYERGPASPDLFTLRPGLFAVFFPGDAHLPQIGGPGTLRKAVAKVRADLLR